MDVGGRHVLGLQEAPHVQAHLAPDLLNCDLVLCHVMTSSAALLSAYLQYMHSFHGWTVHPGGFLVVTWLQQFFAQCTFCYLTYGTLVRCAYIYNQHMVFLGDVVDGTVRKATAVLTAVISGSACLVMEHLKIRPVYYVKFVGKAKATNSAHMILVFVVISLVVNIVARIVIRKVSSNMQLDDDQMKSASTVKKYTPIGVFLIVTIILQFKVKPPSHVLAIIVSSVMNMIPTVYVAHNEPMRKIAADALFKALPIYAVCRKNSVHPM